MAENNPSTYKLFSNLSKDGLYTKSFDEFKAKYSTPEAQAKLHSGLVSDGLYTKSLNDFKSQYFTITPTAQKKNPNPTPQVGKGASALPSTLAGGKSSSVLPQPKNVSVTPGKSQGALLMAPKKPKTAEDFIQVEQQKRDVLSPNFYGGPTTKKPQQPAIQTPQKVSVGEDLQNRFLSSLSDVASFIGSAPNAADQFSMFVTSKLFGFDEEYNALPIAAKREVANMAKGVYGDPTFDGKSKSLQAVEYFDKKSKEFLEKTNQSDKYTSEKIADLYRDPTVEKATDLFLDLPRTFASSLPYTINPYLGAVSLATGKYTKDIEEDQGELNWGQVLNAGVTGISEYYIEKLSRGILNRSVRNALGLPDVARKVAEGWVKSVLKDITWESAGEGVTELVQSLSDDITNGREINWVETAKRAFDAAIKGGALAAGMRTTGAGLGYLSKKVMSAADTKKVNKNTEAIMDLNSKKGPDNSPQVNAVIESKIKELDDENKNIINSNISKVKSMSDAQLKEIVDIDNSINSIKSNRDAIVADPNLSDTEKQSLLDHLKSQAVALNERKSAVEKQAPLTVDSFNNPDEFGLIKFDFSSENEIPSELKNLTPVQMGTSTDKDGNKKIFRSYSVDQINPIIDAIQKQTTSQVPVQPEAGTRLQMAEGESQAEPQVPTQEGQSEEIVVPVGSSMVQAAETQQPTFENKKDSDIEKRMSEIEDDESLREEYNTLENEMEKRERSSVFDIPLENAKEALDALAKKEKEMPNGYGAFADPQDIRESKAVVSKYLNPSEISDSQLMSDFTNALRGNPTSWYADGLKLRESIKESQRRGIAINDLINKGVEVYTKAGYDLNQAKEVVAGMLNKVMEGAKDVTTKAPMGMIDTSTSTGKVQSAETQQPTAEQKQKTNEDIQSKAAGAKVAAEETTQGTQPESGAIEQPLQNISKREEIKKSLEELKDVGILKSAITGKEGISQGEIDAQMALTDAMANVWKETTGRDDFYENFFNEVKQGDIDGLLEKGGVLFQNIELPQRPLTRVSLGVFDLPEFRKMEGQEVAINSLRDLARTRGKQIEKDLMQTTLEFDKYKDAKKISYDEFKSDVEVQVMKLEKIVTSSYASYGADNLGDSDVYGDTNTIIYNSPIDHGEYGHFRGDFNPTAIMGGTMTGGFDMSWNDWEIRQIPGTDQYAAVDKSMPDNVSEYELANYIGTAGTKEEVENWIQSRINHQGNINIGLFGHTRVWYDKGSPYYLAELQSDYFQKNDPNDLYAKQVDRTKAMEYSIQQYIKNDDKRLRERLESDLGVGNVLKIKQDKSGFRLFLNIKGEFKEVLDWPYTEGELNTKEEISKQKENARYRLLKQFHEIVHGSSPIPEKFKSNWGLASSFELQKEFAWNIFDNYDVNTNNLINSYRQEYIKNEIERIKNSEKGVSMLKQFAASQKIHELRLLRESLRNAAQEGAEVLRFPTPYTLAVIEGYVNKAGENGAPYEIVSGNEDRLYQGDIIDYGGIEMVVVDANNREITVAPRDEVYQYDYYDFVNEETDNYTDEVRGEIKRSVGDMNNITEADIDNIEFEDLPWAAKGVEDILRNAIEKSETGSISFSDIEDSISDDIRSYLYEQDARDLFWGDELYSDGDQTYYMVERRGSVENFRQPDEYEEGSSKEDFESQISRDQQTVVNKYKELNKVLKKMRPDAEVVTDENGMEWLETKLTPEDANNPVIAFQEEGGNIKGAVDFSNDNKASVYMFNGADISTLSHEMSGHLGRRFLEQLSSVDEDFAKDYETAKKWAGVKDNQWSTAAEEKWARAFERYLRNGKAPTKSLKSVFSNLRDWLKNIYKYIKGSSIDIKLTPEITKVFDNLLGARSEETGAKDIPGYDRMMGEVDGIIEKSFKRGVPFNQTMDNVMQYMSKSKVYEDATDIQREAMVREVRKMFNKKEKKAPTAKQILGEKPTKTTVVIDEAKEISKRLKALEAAEETGRKKGYKVGIAEADKAKQEVLSYVKSLKVNNKISAAQYGAIVNALDTNLRNPVIRERAKKRIEKIISKANYVDQLERATKIRSAINTAAKSKTLAPNIAKMAKNFAKINPKNVDVIDEYIDMANIVYESVGKPIRIIANEGVVNEYTDMRLKEAQKMEQDALMSEYQYLVDAGLIDAGMSMKDIQQYILDVESKKIEEKKSKEEEIRKRLNSLFDVLSATANAMVNDGINPFTGDKVDISSEDKTLLKGFTKIDLDKLPITSAYRAQEALMNYIVNGKKFGMQAILAKYQGNENVKVAEDKGLKAANFRWGVGGSWWGSRKWAKEVESIPGLFTWVFRGESRGDTMMDLMGVNDILAGSAEAKLKRVKAEQEYIDKFLKTKPGGERFNSIGNTYQRLIYGYLSRSVEGSTEEKQAEFERRKRILSQVVQAMAQSRNKKLIEEGELFSAQFNKVKDAKTVEGIKGKFDKTNEEAVKFVSNMFDADFDFVSGIAEGVYNLLLSKDEFYTPDMFRSIVDEPMNVEESAKTVDIPFESLSKQPAGTLMENKRIQNLPGYDVKNNDASNVEKILRLDFDASVFNAYEKSLIDAYTAIPVQKYSGFVNSKDFSKLFDSSEDQQLFKEILNYYINNERGKIGYKSDLKDIANFSNRLKSFSTVASLGSATAFIKQSVSSILNTSANLSNDKNALGVFRKTLFPNPLSQKEKDNAIAAQEFINKHGGQINLRGAETTADIKSAEKLIRESKKFQTVNDVFDVLDKAARLKMKPLNKGDVPPARASWLAYYVHSLKEQGKPYKNIDWATAEPNKKAIDYANNRVSVNQNASMPSIRGRAFTTKNVGVQLMMAYVMPFTSFLFNAKSRLKTDFTILTSKLATPEDKQAAGRSMAGTLLELPGYLAVSTAINYLFSSIANELVGYDEDEEEKKLRKKRYAELAVTKLVTDFISPAPNVGDAATLALFNTIIDAMQEEQVYEEDVPKQEPFRLFENRPQSMIGAMVETLAQPIGSTGRRASDLYKTMDMLVGDYYESNGKEFQFSREEKNLLAIAALMQGLAGLNLLPSEAESLGTKMAKTIEKKYKKAAKEE